MRIFLILKASLIVFLYIKTPLINTAHTGQQGRIVAVFVGQPEDPEWVYVRGDAAEVMRSVAGCWHGFIFRQNFRPLAR